MEIYPAIDIRNGRVVRLSRGDREAETAYHEDPVALAERFAWQGARWIHIVDLDRAFGDGDNLAVVERIVTRVGSHVQLQVGGGFRTLAQIEAALPTMVTRIVLGTAAVEDPELVGRAVELAGAGRIAIGLDCRDGKVAVRGWTSTSSLDAVTVARRVVADGVRTLIYTDIGRDGMLFGPDIAGAVALSEEGAHVIVSGGIGRRDDLRKIRDARLAGAIVGRALYEGRFTLADALTCAEEGATS